MSDAAATVFSSVANSLTCSLWTRFAKRAATVSELFLYSFTAPVNELT